MEATTRATSTDDPTIVSPETSAVHLPLGLLGFERFKNFNLVGRQEEAPFFWMQAEVDAEVAFLVLRPDEVISDYQPDLSAEDVSFLRLKRPQDALLLNIVTLHPDGRATINLKGPIVVNARTRVGKQVVPANAATYSIQHPLPVGG